MRETPQKQKILSLPIIKNKNYCFLLFYFFLFTKKNTQTSKNASDKGTIRLVKTTKLFKTIRDLT